MFDAQAAWTAVDEAVTQVHALPEAVRSHLVSITIAGSLVRGDFIEDNSDVDIYTIISDDATEAQMEEIWGGVRSCYDRAMSRFRGFTSCPNVWDGVHMRQASLPKSTTEATTHRFKMLGIYLFDLVAHHRMVYGQDVFSRMPQPPDPKDMATQRLNWLCRQADAFLEQRDDHRVSMLAVEAVKALQLRFGQTPTIDKRQVRDIYARFVPEFPAKAVGLQLWDSYANSRYPDGKRDSVPTSVMVEFLRQAQRLGEQLGPVTDDRQDG